MGSCDAQVLMRCGPDRFDEWFYSPLASGPEHPHFAVRRAHPSEFEHVYDLVDAAFGVARPRALYDWLYRRNPSGLARCWVVVERASGRFVANLTSPPWPLARGTERLPATLGVDAVVSPSWQRHGLNRIRTERRDRHPMERATVRLGWPNLSSRGAVRKGTVDASVSGPLPYRVLPLHPARSLIQRGWPWAFARVAERATLTAATAWTTVRLRRGFAGTIEPIGQFDGASDAVTARCAAWDGYWLPHGAEFLNWRYLQHPTRSYQCFAAVINDAVAGYSVVRVDATRALLMELVAPPSSAVAGVLLLRAITAAREAGCEWLAVCAAPRWWHWPLVRSAGFVKTRRDVFFLTSVNTDADVGQLERWQFLPGDCDSA